MCNQTGAQLRNRPASPTRAVARRRVFRRHPRHVPRVSQDHCHIVVTVFLGNADRCGAQDGAADWPTRLKCAPETGQQPTRLANLLTEP
jgi:hypothetical protein